MSLPDLEKEMKASADFVTEVEIKVCLECGHAYMQPWKLICPRCASAEHTKTLLIVATWKVLPKHLQDGAHTGPGVRVTNIGGNAI